MRKITLYMLWLFVFTVPWDAVTLPFFGSLSRIAGLAAFGFAAVTIVMEGKVRKPGAIMWTALLFVASSALSLLWTIAYDDTFSRVFTYAQLVGAVWMIEEFARSEEQQESLLLAFCVGSFVPIVNLLDNYRSDTQISMKGRYSANGLNADDLGLTLVLGIPMAWYLMLRTRGLARALSVAYLVVAPLSVLLTGTRGAFLAALIALTIIPITLPRIKPRTLGLIAALFLVASVGIAYMVPSSTWTRMATIDDELQGGSMTGRMSIWKAGMEVFPDRPVLGVGAGAFGVAVEPFFYRREAPHNLVVGVLVEQGVVGVALFFVLLGTCAYAVLGLQAPERNLYAVVLASWMVGAMSANFEFRKVTWLLFGLVASRYALESLRVRSARRLSREGDGRPLAIPPPPRPSFAGDARVIPLSPRWDRTPIQR